jgi:hypothetical protein
MTKVPNTGDSRVDQLPSIIPQFLNPAIRRADDSFRLGPRGASLRAGVLYLLSEPEATSRRPACRPSGLEAEPEAGPEGVSIFGLRISQRGQGR